MAFCSPRKDVSRALRGSCFYPPWLVEAISGTDIADYFLEGRIVSVSKRLRSACAIAVKLSSSPIEPRRTQYDKVVHGFFFHIAVIVEGLTGKICTFLLADVWRIYYYDMTI